MDKILNYVIGDATRPQGEGKKAIIHCCNDIGGWGSGFVLAVSARCNLPERCYREWHGKRQTYIDTRNGLCISPDDTNCHIFNEAPFVLGQIQPVQYAKDPDLAVINMIGQRSTSSTVINVGEEKVVIPPVRYDALSECLHRVACFCLRFGYTVHCPRFGAGLAGGDWFLIEHLIKRNLCEKGVRTTVYDLQ